MDYEANYIYYTHQNESSNGFQQYVEKKYSANEKPHISI